MRILSIKFKNLNSLKGEHTIDFKSPPFSESELFAITGATGSGKTTILDAITVALYGKVHRHNKDVEEIMSRHTGECYSEVEFESKGLVFRSKWSLSRARGKADGKMQSERMELSEYRESQFVMIGEHTPTLIKRQIEELCGLDYAQFLRSVILSQGDFTRFLKSTDRERSELLENITGTEVYSEISMFVFKKEKQERDALVLLQQKLGDVNLLSIEEISVVKQQLTELAAQESIFREQHKSTSAALTWFEGVKKLEARKSALEADLAGLESKLILNQGNFEQLKWHQTADKYTGQYRAINVLIEEEANLKRKLSAIELQIPVLADKVADANGRRTLAQEKLREAENNQELLNPVIDQAIQKDEEIKSLNSLFITSTAEINAINPEISKLGTQRNILEERLKNLDKDILVLSELLGKNQVDATLDKQLLVFNQHAARLQEIQTNVKETVLKSANDNDLYLNGHAESVQMDKDIEVSKKTAVALESELKTLTLKIQEALQDKAFEQLESEMNSLPDLISKYQLLLESAEAIKKTRQEYLGLKGTITELENQLSLKRSSLEKQNTDLKAGQQLLELHKRLVESEQLIQNYEADRKNLQEGEPCMLCGSVHHPFVTQAQQHQLSEAQQQFAAQQLFVDQLTRQVLDVTIEMERVQANLESFTRQLNEKAIAGSEIKNKFHQLKTPLPFALDIDHPDNIRLLWEETRTKWLRLKDRVQHIRQSKDQMTALQTQAEENNKHLLTLEGKLGVLKENLRGLKEKTEQTGLVLKGLSDKEAEEINHIRRIIMPFGLDFKVEDLQVLTTTMHTRNQRYLQASDQLLIKKEALINLNKELDPLVFKLEEQQRLLNRAVEYAGVLNRNLAALKEERLHLFGARNPVHERNRIAAEIKDLTLLTESADKVLQHAEKANAEAVFNLKQQEEWLADLLRKKDQMQAELKQQLAEEGIDGLDALTALLLPDEQAQQLATVKQQLDEALAMTKEFIKQNSAELQIENLKSLTTADLDTLQLRIAEVNDKMSVLNQEIGGLKMVLQNDAKLNVQHQELNSHIQQQQTILLKWSNLNALIGAADGQKFRLFAQGLTLARLTDLANLHLKQLTDRYSILKGKEDLLLLIEDSYQAGAVRPMATLSGGESFLVSLALALGLSDLASHKVQINSLFIDEGFGTLDADTLDVAISALENLQAKGKTIGIISHVEALKERIGTQVQIMKQPGGSSKIRIQDYGKTVLEELLN